MPAIDRTDHLYELVTETIDANGKACPECHDTAPGDKLLVFFTVRGQRSRQHRGAFCSRECHDIYHGLKPRR